MTCYGCNESRTKMSKVVTLLKIAYETRRVRPQFAKLYLMFHVIVRLLVNILLKHACLAEIGRIIPEFHSDCRKLSGHSGIRD